MSKLRLVVALTVSAALAPMAAAQTVSDPEPYYGVPPVAIAGAPTAAMVQGATPHTMPPGAGMHRPGMGPGMPPGGGMHAMPPRGSHWGGGMRGGGTVHGPRPGGMAGPPPMHQVRRMPHPGGGTHFRQFRRINRGGFVPQFWWGPQFIVHNWSGYGFPQPYAGGRWIRYYDDAYMIDRSGRVLDSRYGHDWSREEERWSRDGNGVPVYVGDGDFQPERWDYEWAENCERNGCGDETYAEGDYGPPPGHDGPPPGYGGPPPGAYGYGHGSGSSYSYGSTYGGYGYCACGPVVVTETTVTTAPVVEQVTYYEYVTERARPAPRVKTRRIKAHRVAPYAGERG